MRIIGAGTQPGYQNFRCKQLLHHACQTRRDDVCYAVLIYDAAAAWWKELSLENNKLNKKLWDWSIFCFSRLHETNRLTQLHILQLHKCFFFQLQFSLYNCTKCDQLHTNICPAKNEPCEMWSLLHDVVVKCGFNFPPDRTCNAYQKFPN